MAYQLVVDANFRWIWYPYPYPYFQANVKNRSPLLSKSILLVETVHTSYSPWHTLKLLNFIKYIVILLIKYQTYFIRSLYGHNWWFIVQIQLLVSYGPAILDLPYRISKWTDRFELHLQLVSIFILKLVFCQNRCKVTYLGVVLANQRASYK